MLSSGVLQPPRPLSPLRGDLRCLSWVGALRGAAWGCRPAASGFSPACVFLQGIFHFQLGRGEPMLHTRVRPHCREFLEKIARLYELHVFTFGSRLYAHTIAGARLRPRSPVRP